MNEVAGLFDNLLKVGFDYKALCADADFRNGIKSIATALKKATSSPLNLDDKVIDGIVASIEALLDTVKQHGPVVVGSKVYTVVDADNFLAKMGGNVPPVCAMKLKQYPQIIEALEGLSPEKQLKAVMSETVIDRLISILLNWGPAFLKIALMILPFLI